MKSIRVRNLRSFDNEISSPFIDIKPITVLVGKNSCGKSSLLRTFPLLRQSIESNTSGPILWYGQYVDYGAFSEAKNKSNQEKSIFFDYKFDLKKVVKGLSHRLRDYIISIEFTLEVTEKNKSTIAKSAIIKLNDILIEIDYFPSVNIKVDGVIIIDSLLTYSPKHSLIPLVEHDAFRFDELFPSEMKSLTDESNLIDEDIDDYIEGYLADIDEIYSSNNAISRFHVNEIMKIIVPLKEDKFPINENDYLTNMSIMSKQQLRFKIESIFNLSRKLTEIELDRIHRLNTVCFTPEIIDLINIYFRDYTSQIKYVAPLRATAERFYRFQDLRVEEIDHTGSNLAMLLRNLRPYEMIRFQEWCDKYFGFIISVPETDNLHYEINVTINEQTQNISDMGFGFSQILPIVTTLWLETSKRAYSNKAKILTFVIEQPELHLHPEFQAILARVFSAISCQKNRGVNIHIIFETHSKTMIDAIGDYIEEHECPEIANIYIFEKEGNNTTVLKSEFDDDGDLVNWPIGFFSGR